MNLARNTGWILAGRVAALGLSILLTIVLARRLGLDGFAGYAILTSVVWIANVVTTFGTDMVLAREIARGGSVAVWRAALTFQIVLSVPAMAAVWMLAPMLPWPADDGGAALRILSVSLFPFAATSVASAVLRGVGAMGRYALVGVVAAAVPLASIWWFVAADASLVQVAQVLLVAQVLVALVSWIVAAGRVPELRRLAMAGRIEIVAIARSSLPLGILGALGMAVQRAPVVVTAALAGPAATAFLAAAQRVAEASRMGHVAFFSALLPELAAPGAAPSVVRRSWQTSIAAALVVAVGLLAFGPTLVAVLYGAAYAPAATALAILALGVVPSAMATHRTLALVVARRERDMAIGLGAGAIALVLLLVTLVPAFGWAGACWAIVLANVVELGALAITTRQLTRRAESVVGNAVEAAVP